jgi:PIN domain nuclease of toxin-antitoxin system
VKLLLDTHAFLWWVDEIARIAPEARRAVGVAEAVFVSAASAWEVAIKVKLGRLRTPGPFEDAVEKSRFEKLLIEFRHAAAAGLLVSHHRDPFDRMLVAQAQLEGLTIVTHDRHFEPYGVSIIWT